MLRRLWSANVGVFLAFWLFLMLAGQSKMFRDPGTFWHTALGEQMLRDGRLVHWDSFSFTRYGQPWPDQYWLCDCAMAILYRVGGWDSLLLLTATTLAGLYTWAAVRLRIAGLDLVCALLVVVVAMASSSPQFHVRPSIATVALLALTFALLNDVEAGRRPFHQLGWLIPLFALWTNVHGGVLGGFATTVLVATGWCFAPFLGWHCPVRSVRQAVALLALVAACAAALLASPYGWDLPKLWFSILRLPLSDLIQEHGKLTRFPMLACFTVLFAILYAAIFAGALPKIRVSWLLPLVWFVLACQHSRHSALFAIVAVLAMADLLPHSRCARLLARRDLFRFPGDTPSIPQSKLPGALLIVPLVVALGTLAVQALDIRAPVFGRGWVNLDPNRWPVELLPQLRQIDEGGLGDARIFNDMLFGGFLIFHTSYTRVFIDDRCELYGKDFLFEYAHACQDDPSQLDRWARDYGFRYALVMTGTNLDRYAEQAENWILIRRTPAATLYQRADSPTSGRDKCADRTVRNGRCLHHLTHPTAAAQFHPSYGPPTGRRPEGVAGSSWLFSG
jgi:hypothetical protein